MKQLRIYADSQVKAEKMIDGMDMPKASPIA
jgi:hypothetical protein